MGTGSTEQAILLAKEGDKQSSVTKKRASQSADSVLQKLSDMEGKLSTQNIP